MELNREQIIKALECCHSSAIADCKHCTYRGKADDEEDLGITCLNVLLKDTLALIKELTEENERLRKNLETFKGKQKSLQKQIEVLSKENHLLLSKDFDITVGDCHIVFSNGKKGNIYTFTEKDQIAKEMLEGKDEKG